MAAGILDAHEIVRAKVFDPRVVEGRIGAAVLTYARRLWSSMIGCAAGGNRSRRDAGWAGLATGFVAALYWYGSSTVSVEPGWYGMEPVIREAAIQDWIAGLLQAGSEAARLNKIAALWTAATVVLGAIGNLAAAWN